MQGLEYKNILFVHILDKKKELSKNWKTTVEVDSRTTDII